MLYQYLRIIKGVDLSLNNQDENQVLSLGISTGEYIYIGQYFPFNNLFFWVDSPNVNSAVLGVQYWANKEWIDAVDVLDGTSVSGVPFAQSGVIQFSPKRDKNFWQEVEDTSEVSQQNPPELNGHTIYDLYWIRIKTSANLSATDLKRVTYAFTTSQQLSKLDVEVNQFLNAFESGKLDWTREIITATELMIRDLMRRGLVVNRGQVLRFDDVSIPCDLKTLSLIYSNLGNAYKDKRLEKESEYEQAINIRNFTFDQNNNGAVDKAEVGVKVSRFIR